MNDVTLGISILSVVIAALALYFSQLRKAKIKSILGPQIEIYHHDYEHGTSTGFVIPISLINDSPSTGTVIKAAISICQKGMEDERFFLQWQKFEVLDEVNRKWMHDSDAHPLVLPAKSGVHKNVWFMWNSYNSKKFYLSKGTYEICLHIWHSESEAHIKINKTFFVSEEIANFLEDFRNKKLTNSIKLVLDKELEINRLMNKSEFEKLL